MGLGPAAAAATLSASVNRVALGRGSQRGWLSSSFHRQREKKENKIQHVYQSEFKAKDANMEPNQRLLQLFSEVVMCKKCVTALHKSGPNAEGVACDIV